MKRWGPTNDPRAHRAPGVAVDVRRNPMPLVAVRRIAIVLAAMGLLTASAYLSVPFYPVPLTMQTLAVLLIGGLLGPVAGASSVAAYLALGAAGAPVFHNGLGGAAVLAGPTGGYLVGFVAAAFIMGVAVRWGARVSRRGVTGATLTGWRSLGILALGVAAASAVIYAVGVPWLAVFTGGGLGSAFALGAVPFLLGDLLKGAVAVGALCVGGKALARRGMLLP
jgi:biotin transport system substrate-specific component